MEFLLLGYYILVTARPSQWIKNFVVFIPVLFSFNESWTFQGNDNLYSLFLNAILILMAFTFITISVYCVNDIFDRENDQEHPFKKHRPIASGDLPVLSAIWISLFFMILSLLITFCIDWVLSLSLLFYFLLMIGYSYKLKEIIFVDAISISLGFVIRVIAGAIAIDVPISTWLCLCMILGALFISVSKRFSEIWVNNETFLYQRSVLKHYSRLKKNVSIFILAIIMLSTICVYFLYRAESIVNFLRVSSEINSYKLKLCLKKEKLTNI